MFAHLMKLFKNLYNTRAKKKERKVHKTIQINQATYYSKGKTDFRFSTSIQRKNSHKHRYSTRCKIENVPGRFRTSVPEREEDGQPSGARSSVAFFFPASLRTWPPTHESRLVYRKEARAPIGVQMCPPVVDNGQRRRRL